MQAPHTLAQGNGSTAADAAAAAPAAASAPAGAATGAAGPSLQPAVTHVQRDAPGEVAAASTEEDYLEYRETTDMREPYRQGAGRRAAAATALPGRSQPLPVLPGSGATLAHSGSEELGRKAAQGRLWASSA